MKLRSTIGSALTEKSRIERSLIKSSRLLLSNKNNNNNNKNSKNSNNNKFSSSSTLQQSSKKKSISPMDESQDSSCHQHHNQNLKKEHNRPMVHLSSAPNVKFTGKKIGSSHPIVPHPTTPQKRIVVQTTQNTKNSTTDPSSKTIRSSESPTVNLSLPSYALNGIVVNNDDPSCSTNINNIAIHNLETIHKIRKASQLAADMLHQACEVAQNKPFMTTDDIDRIIHCSILNHKISIDGNNHGDGNHHTISDNCNDRSTKSAHTSDKTTIIHAYPSPLNYNHFPKSICCSVNEVICHGIPDLRRLQNGDLLSIDVSVYLNGVHGDNCASILIGDDSDFAEEEGKEVNDQRLEIDDNEDEIFEQKERAKTLILATKEAMYAAINVCHHGTPLNEIGNAVHDVAEKYGFRPMKHVFGHGIGPQLHMNPQIKHYRNNDDQITLQAGMVITIEPALVEGHHAYTTWGDGWSKCTVDGGLSAQFEHTILINEEGSPEILTSRTTTSDLVR